ncbi:hypothetical protein PENSPDRAFT_647916 [Peniophora sp. CONT]|nr:hypothetical protein PENSPDRAFT_647916 [Peniophora sp. CONT]
MAQLQPINAPLPRGFRFHGSYSYDAQPTHTPNGGPFSSQLGPRNDVLPLAHNGHPHFHARLYAGPTQGRMYITLYEGNQRAVHWPGNDRGRDLNIVEHPYPHYGAGATRNVQAVMDNQGHFVFTLHWQHEYQISSRGQSWRLYPQAQSAWAFSNFLDGHQLP